MFLLTYSTTSNARPATNGSRSRSAGTGQIFEKTTPKQTLTRNGCRTAAGAEQRSLELTPRRTVDVSNSQQTHTYVVYTVADFISSANACQNGFW